VIEGQEKEQTSLPVMLVKLFARIVLNYANPNFVFPLCPFVSVACTERSRMCGYKVLILGLLCIPLRPMRPLR
jgi:hypothetical protein